MAMYEKLKISHPRHSGRLRLHEHTSYIPLAFLVVIAGVLLIKFSITSFVAADSPGPQAGSIGLNGIVPTNPPTLAATITTPKDGQHFSTTPVQISGSCPIGTLVEIYKNSIFAGSTPCQSGGSYSVEVDLLYGKNVLTAQVFDSLNQAGPVSTPVTVFNDTAPPQSISLSFLNLSGAQLLLDTDAIYRGSFPGQLLNVPITILGGTAPFAVNVEWGDSNNKVIPRSDNSIFNASHTYQKPGTYKVTFQASDAQQQAAFLSVAAIINGQPVVVSSTDNAKKTKSLLNKLLVLWPLYSIVLTLVVSFWVGEQHEKKVLGKNTTQQNPSLGFTPHVSL